MATNHMVVSLDDGTANYNRIVTLLLEEGTRQARIHLKNLLPKGASLELVLQENSQRLTLLRHERNRLTAQQWKLLFPAKGHVDINSLDLSLCVFLLKNLQQLDNNTSDQDFQNLRRFRNKIIHRKSNKMTDREFSSEWTYLSGLLQRLGTAPDIISMYRNKNMDPVTSAKQLGEQQKQHKEYISKLLTTVKGCMDQIHISYYAIPLAVLVTGVMLAGTLLIYDDTPCKINIQFIQSDKRLDQFIAFLPRSGWNIRQLKSSEERLDPRDGVTYIIVADTMTPGKVDTTELCCGVVRQIQNNHMDIKGYSSIGWNFLIGEDGVVYEGRGWDIVGSHTPGWNHRSYGIAFIGEYNKRLPQHGALTVLDRLIKYGISMGKISPHYELLGQCQIKNRPTPGKMLYQYVQQRPEWRRHIVNDKIEPHCNDLEYKLPDTIQEGEVDEHGYIYALLMMMAVFAFLSICALMAQRSAQPPKGTRKIYYAPMSKQFLDCYIFMPRKGWEAREPKPGLTALETTSKLKYIIVCDTSKAWSSVCDRTTDCCACIRHLQNIHMDSKGWSDIGYNFLVGEDGIVYEGRGWHIVGSHTCGWNISSYCIAFLGNFTTRAPKRCAMMALENLLEHGVAKGKVTERYILYGQRQVRPFENPSKMLYGEIQKMPHWKPISDGTWSPTQDLSYDSDIEQQELHDR